MDVKITHAISRESFLKALSGKKLSLFPKEREATDKPEPRKYKYQNEEGVLEAIYEEYSVCDTEERNKEYCNVTIECINSANKSTKVVRIAAITIEQEAICKEFLEFVLEELINLGHIGNNDRILVSTQNKRLSTTDWSRTQLKDNLSKWLCYEILLRSARDNFKLPEETPNFCVEN